MVFVIFFLLIRTLILSQTNSIENGLKFNQNLFQDIDSIVIVDQKWRNLLTRYWNNTIDKDSIEENFIKMNLKFTDNSNLKVLRRIFYHYGYPNYDLVGEKGSHNFWLLVQHQDKYSSFQDSVLLSMKIEAEKGKASWVNYAYLLDRVKVNTGQFQVYGTQMQLNKDSTSYEPKSVIEPEKLNDRRKSVGLNSIEEYIEIMNSHYFGTLNRK